MKAHFGSDLVEGLGQEADGARSGLESPKRVPGGLSSHAHGLGHAVEQRRHGLMLPALDTPQLGRCAPGPERAGERAAQVALEIDAFV